MLIFFRVMQGAVSGPMIPLSQSILLANYPEHRKGFADARAHPEENLQLPTGCRPLLALDFSENHIRIRSLRLGHIFILTCYRQLAIQNFHIAASFPERVGIYSMPFC